MKKIWLPLLILLFSTSINAQTGTYKFTYFNGAKIENILLTMDVDYDGSLTDELWWQQVAALTASFDAKLNIADIDNEPVDSEIAAPISSGWAFTFVNTTLPATYWPLTTDIWTEAENTDAAYLNQTAADLLYHPLWDFDFDDLTNTPTTLLGYGITDGDKRGTEGETMLSTGDGDATPDISNAGTGIASRLWQSANTGSTTITDFDDGDNHTEFAEGDWFTLRVDDANTIIDFTTDSNIRRGDGSGLNFTGSADYPYVLEFKYTGTWWQCTNIPPGLTSPTAYASSTFGDATITTDADGLTMTAALMHNGKVIATGAGVINALDIDSTANFVITSTTADNVDLNPDDSDSITYCDSDSCATGAAGEALRLTNIGDVAACTYAGSANAIHCNVSDGVAEESP